MNQTNTASTQSNNDLHERVAFVLDRIRPAVQEDGGDIELIDVTDSGVVKIRMHGACVGCPSSNMTLRIGIERNLKERIPEITAVEAVDAT
ncbi:MAG: NifU family protein [Phycisphaerales bacterium]|nr:NifU family protein [Phycisphaerales bacterium]